MDNEIEHAWEKTEKSCFRLLNPIDRLVIKSTFFSSALMGYEMAIKRCKTATGEYETTAHDPVLNYLHTRMKEVGDELKIIAEVNRQGNHETK